MALSFDPRNHTIRKAGSFLPLSSLTKELGAEKGEDASRLKQRLLDLCAKCDARYSDASAFFLPAEEKKLGYVWRDLKSKLSWLDQGGLMEPTLQAVHGKEAGELSMLREKCGGLHELELKQTSPGSGTIAEKIEFAVERVRKGAQVSPEERERLFMCQHQLGILREGRRAFISAAELELLNDFWKFKEEFETFDATRAPRPGSGWLGESSFRWASKDGRWLPTLDSRYKNSTVLDMSHHYFQDLIVKNEANLKVIAIFEEHFDKKLTRRQAIQKIALEHPKFQLDWYLEQNVFERPVMLERLRARSLANIEILTRFLRAAVGPSEGRDQRLMAVVRELRSAYPPPAENR